MVCWLWCSGGVVMVVIYYWCVGGGLGVMR